MNKKLTSMVDEILSEIKKGNASFSRLFGEDKIEDIAKKKHSKSGSLPDKEFLPRNSLLTDLVEVKHIRSLYHIHIVAVIIMFLNCFIHDFVASGR